MASKAPICSVMSNHASDVLTRKIDRVEMRVGRKELRQELRALADELEGLVGLLIASRAAGLPLAEVRYARATLCAAVRQNSPRRADRGQNRWTPAQWAIGRALPNARILRSNPPRFRPEVDATRLVLRPAIH